MQKPQNSNLEVFTDSQEYNKIAIKRKTEVQRKWNYVYKQIIRKLSGWKHKIWEPRQSDTRDVSSQDKAVKICPLNVHRFF